jgi:hypothetical protein
MRKRSINHIIPLCGAGPHPARSQIQINGGHAWEQRLRSNEEKLTARELQILDHLEQAQNLDAPLTEYAAAYNLDVKDLYAGKAQLVKKGLLPGRTATPERADFVPVRVAEQ